MQATRGRAGDDAFAARANLAAAAIVIVSDATASQSAALIRTGAGAVVAAGLVVEPLRADAFLALALMLQHSFLGPGQSLALHRVRDSIKMGIWAVGTQRAPFLPGTDI
jgi:hypothetical protein